MINLEDIEEARETIGSLIKRTPLTYSQYFSDLCGGEVYLKLENLQITNSFKIRGALNKMLHLSIEERKRGVVTASAGNHAQGVAYAASRLGLKSTIVMPSFSPVAKIQATQSYGANVVLFGTAFDDALAHALELADETGATFLHPFNDENVIAGQGTIGLEIVEELPEVEVVARDTKWMIHSVRSRP